MGQNLLKSKLHWTESAEGHLVPCVGSVTQRLLLSAVRSTPSLPRLVLLKLSVSYLALPVDKADTLNDMINRGTAT